MKITSQVHSRKRINNPSQIMRYAVALSFTLLFLNLSIAQRIEVATDLTPIVSLETDGNDIYFGQAFTKKIFKFNPLDPVPTAPGEVLTVSGVSFLSPVFEYANNHMYMANTKSGQIFKIDLTATTPAPIEIFNSNGLLSEGMVFKDNFLYFAYDYSVPHPTIPGTTLDVNKIVKIDVTAASPTAIELTTVSNLFVRDLEFRGNDLYAVLKIANSFDGGEVSKFDVTDPNPVWETVIPSTIDASTLAIKDDKLYVFENFGGNREIIQLDLLAPDPAATATNVVTAADLPNSVQDILFVGDVLYMCEFSSGIVSKIDFSISTSTEDNISNYESIKLYPNPTTDYIEVQGLKSKQDYRIYNMATSSIVGRGQLSDGNKIDIHHLSSGAYILRFKNGKIITFIKQ